MFRLSLAARAEFRSTSFRARLERLHVLECGGPPRGFRLSFTGTRRTPKKRLQEAVAAGASHFNFADDLLAERNPFPQLLSSTLKKNA
jgi:hypothetical protein